MFHKISLLTRFMGPPWGPAGVDRTQVGPILAPWTLLSGTYAYSLVVVVYISCQVMYLIWFGITCIIPSPNNIDVLLYDIKEYAEWINLTWLMNNMVYVGQTHQAHVHDDVIKWKHFPRYWPIVRGNHEAGHLRRHLAHYDVIVIKHELWVTSFEWSSSLRMFRFIRSKSIHEMFTYIGRVTHMCVGKLGPHWQSHIPHNAGLL